MAKAEILSHQASLIGIELERPFPLGFGTLSHLPRVLLEISALDKGKIIKGIGEASIDFPFSHYDAFDILHALQSISLEGSSLNERQAILKDKSLRQQVLFETPAAFAALNMALDDAVGKASGRSVPELYGQIRSSGQALASISYQENPSLLIEEMEKKNRIGFIPKPKVGQSVEADIETIMAVEEYALRTETQYVLDFNAKYTLAEAEKIFAELSRRGCLMKGAIFIEQPTKVEEGISALVTVKGLLARMTKRTIGVLADESFVTLDDAIEAVSGGLALNFKIHKVGGLYYAREIETALIKHGLSARGSMVGGTFPTAIGRAYDQQSASVLRTTTAPGDGWEPSTDWFTGKRHLIKEEFPEAKNGRFTPIDGDGIGITPDTEKISALLVPDPIEEYRKIRHGKTGDKIVITLNKGRHYSETYLNLTGKDPDWNLR